MKKNTLIIYLIFVFGLLTLQACDKYGDLDMEGSNIDGFISDAEEAHFICSNSKIAPPIYVERANGKPAEKEITFKKGDFDLGILVRTVTPKSPGAAVIAIDDIPIAYTSDFNANFESLFRRIANSEIGPGEHTLKVKLMGKPGSALQIILNACGRRITEADGYSREELYVNSQKARLLREEERRLQFQFSMKRYITPGELYKLMQDSGGAEIDSVVFKVFNGDSFCSTPENFPGNELLLETKEFMRKQLEKGEYGPGCGEDVRAALQYDLNSGNISAPIFTAMGTPRQMYELWEKYPDEIRVIQTITHDLEKAQNTYWPNEEIR